MRRLNLLAALIVCGASVGLSAQTPAGEGPPEQNSFAPPPPKIARISGGILAGSILTKVPPMYPPEAKAAHLSGTVVLHAIIAKDGTIEKLEAISGPEMLRGSAMDAVQQWTYKPYLLNGKPTEVDTTITVNYNLNVDPLPSETSSLPSPKRVIRISGGVLAGNILTKAQPVYPADALAAHVSGTVVIRVMVSKDGVVVKAEVISGPDLLKDSAVEAVKQWVYKPYLLNGEAVDVDSIVTVNYNIAS